MPHPENIDLEQFQRRDHDVLLKNGYDSLFAESSERTARKTVASAVVDSTDPHPGAYWETAAAAVPLPELTAASAIVSEAHTVLAEARSRHEDYSLRDASHEEIIAMMHAVSGKYGEEVATSTGTDPKKLEIARVQLVDALKQKMQQPDRADYHEAVDSATFVLTAVALARMRQETMDSVEKVLATDALGSLREAGDLELIKHQEKVGYHTGEIAVAAIMGYEPVIA